MSLTILGSASYWRHVLLTWRRPKWAKFHYQNTFESSLTSGLRVCQPKKVTWSSSTIWSRGVYSIHSGRGVFRTLFPTIHKYSSPTTEPHAKYIHHHLRPPTHTSLYKVQVMPWYPWGIASRTCPEYPNPQTLKSHSWLSVLVIPYSWSHSHEFSQTWIL